MEFEILSSSIENITFFMSVLQMVLISVPSRNIGSMMSGVQECVNLTATILTTFQTFCQDFGFLEQTINEISFLYATLFKCCFQTLQLCLKHRISILHFIYIVKYLLTYLLNLWCRVLLEKLTGLQLVKKFPAFHGTRMFITALTSFRHLSLSWASPIQSIYPHPTSWRSILILSTHLPLSLPSGLFLSGFPTKTIYTTISLLLIVKQKFCASGWLITEINILRCTVRKHQNLLKGFLRKGRHIIYKE